MLKDDADWGAVGVKDGARLMMMGTADAPPTAPAAPPVFAEDLDGLGGGGEEEADGMGGGGGGGGGPPEGAGGGLANLGNTCYLNATVQCLARVPELSDALAALGRGGAGGGGGGVALSHPDQAAARLAAAAGAAFTALAAARGATVEPAPLLSALRARFPQFAQAGPGGVPAQQDAEECWSQLLCALRDALPPAPAASSPAAPADPPAIIDRLFGVRTAATLTCAPTGETAPHAAGALALKCVITSDVNHVTDGLKLALKEDREAASPALGGQLAPWAGDSRIARLPPYLTVQLARFFYKVEAQQKAKILRKVTFPLDLDLYDLCTPEYQAALAGPRAAAQAAADAAAGLAGDRGSNATSKEVPLTAKDVADAAAKARADAEEAGEAGASGAEAMAADEPAPAPTPAGPSPFAGQLTGRYELVAVLTHKGRSADSGHYVSWARLPEPAPGAAGAAPPASKKPKAGSAGGGATWIQYDDDSLSPRTPEEVLALSGGGDWHMAYLLLYRAVVAP
jgi:ubiquitin carboxyl-terminal hydrolase 14